MRLRSVSELETTLRISAVAVCCSEASPSFTGQAREVRLFGGIPTSRGFGWIAGAWGGWDSRVDFLVCCLQWVAVFVLSMIMPAPSGVAPVSSHLDLWRTVDTNLRFGVCPQ